MTLEERITRLAEESYHKGAVDFSASLKESLQKLVDMGIDQSFSLAEMMAMVESAEQELERLRAMREKE